MSDAYLDVIQDLIPTANALGHLLATPEEYNKAFMDYASPANGPCLELGAAAYGALVPPSLEKGTYVVANDLDGRRLKTLQDKVPFAVRDRLELRPDRMPDDVHFEEGTFGAVLASGVINFIHPDKLETSIKSIFRWLKPNGKLFMAAASPFKYKGFQKIFEKRKKEGDPWPGFIDDVARFTPEYSHAAPEFINLLDEDMLTKLLSKAGFIIEKTGFRSLEAPLDPQNHIGVIAFKP